LWLTDLDTVDFQGAIEKYYDRLEKDLTPVRSNPISVAITSAFEGGRQ